MLTYWVAIYILIIVVFLILEPYLFNPSLSLIKYVQSYAKSDHEWIKTTAKFFGDLGDGKPYFVYMIYLLSTGYHFESASLALILMISQFHLAMLKVLLAKPRPYYLEAGFALPPVLDC